MNPFHDLNSSFDQNRLESYMAARNAPTPAPVAAPKPNKHNFLIDNISTVGGILGGLAGGAGGALLGGVGAVPGAAAGGAVGSGLGQALENAITGDNIGHDVAKEALLGGIFSAGPVKLLKFGLGVPAALAARGGEEVAGNAVKALVENGGKAAADNLAGQAGDQALKTSFTGRLTTAGNKALASQYGTIGKNIARETNPLDTIGKLADMGITKPSDAERIARGFTGSDGLLTQQVANAIGKAGKVSVDTIPLATQSAIEQNALHGLPEANALSKLVEANMATIQKAGGTPDSVMGAIRNLESQAAQKLGKSGTYHLATATDKQFASALRDVTDELKNQLYEAAGANKNVANVLTPEVRNQLLKLHPNNAQWQNFIDNGVMKAKNIGDLRSAQAPFVNIQKIIHEADLNNMTFGGRVGNAFGGPGGIAGKALDLAAAPLKNPASRLAGTTLRDIGTGQAVQQAPKSLGGLASGLGTVNFLANSLMPSHDQNTLEGAVAGQSVGPNSQPQTMSPNTAQMMNTNMPAQYQQSADMSSSPYTKEALVYDINRDPKNAEKYIAYYDNLDKIFNTAAAAPKLNATQIQQQNTALSGMQSLQDIAGFLQQNPNAPKSDALPGFTRGLTGTSNYHAAIINASDAIGRLRSGGAIGKEEEARFMELLPKPFDPPAAIQYKLGTLNNIFARFADPQSAAAATPDLSSAITGGY